MADTSLVHILDKISLEGIFEKKIAILVATEDSCPDCRVLYGPLDEIAQNNPDVYVAKLPVGFGNFPNDSDRKRNRVALEEMFDISLVPVPTILFLENGKLIYNPVEELKVSNVRTELEKLFSYAFRNNETKKMLDVEDVPIYTFESLITSGPFNYRTWDPGSVCNEKVYLIQPVAKGQLHNVSDVSRIADIIYEMLDVSEYVMLDLSNCELNGGLVFYLSSKFEDNKKLIISAGSKSNEEKLKKEINNPSVIIKPSVSHAQIYLQKELKSA